MNYVLVGCSHHDVPVAVREKLAFDAARAEQTLKRAVSGRAVSELALLSTCNRVELYAAGPDAKAITQDLQQLLTEPLGALQSLPPFYCKDGHEAVSHLFKVTASLDSMVVGETQIVRQVRDAYRLAREATATGPMLNRLFHRALFVAKRVKTETGIGRGNLSVGGVSLALARKIFGELDEQNVLLYGAGETGELVLRHLRTGSRRGQTSIVNRTFERALDLEKVGLGKARPESDLPAALIEADIFVTSVATELTHFDKNYFRKLMSDRGNRPLFVIDLGVPRNLSQDVGEIDGVYLYNVDDLAQISRENLDARSDKIDHALGLIEDEARAFFSESQHGGVLPVIADLNRKWDSVRVRELEKTFAKMPHLSEMDRENMDRLTRSIVAKILHDPIFALKDKTEPSEPGMLKAFRRLFRLDEEEQNET